MVQVKTHKRKGRNKVSVVRRHSRKDKVSAFRGAKDFSTKQRDKLASKGDALPDGSYPIANWLTYCPHVECPPQKQQFLHDRLNPPVRES